MPSCFEQFMVDEGTYNCKNIKEDKKKRTIEKFYKCWSVKSNIICHSFWNVPFSFPYFPSPSYPCPKIPWVLNACNPLPCQTPTPSVSASELEWVLSSFIYLHVLRSSSLYLDCSKNIAKQLNDLNYVLLQSMYQIIKYNMENVFPPTKYQKEFNKNPQISLPFLK